LNDTPENSPAAPAPLSADTRGSEFELKSWDIAPEDQALADEITGKDPVFGNSGPTTFSGSVKLPDTIRATGLPPHLRDPIMAQLANVPESRRDAEEKRLVHAALYENSLGVRIVCGPGQGADPYWRARFALTFEIEEAEREAIRLGNELAEVERWDNVADERTGERKPVPVEKLQGERRRAVEAQRQLVLRKLDSLNGIEGERRLAKAKFEAVEEAKALRAQLADDKEAKKRADEQLREERIAERANLYAKHRRTTR
jgi:hypothetical protein